MATAKKLITKQIKKGIKTLAKQIKKASKAPTRKALNSVQKTALRLRASFMWQAARQLKLKRFPKRQSSHYAAWREAYVSLIKKTSRSKGSAKPLSVIAKVLSAKSEKKARSAKLSFGAEVRNATLAKVMKALSKPPKPLPKLPSKRKLVKRVKGVVSALSKGRSKQSRRAIKSAGDKVIKVVFSKRKLPSLRKHYSSVRKSLVKLSSVALASPAKSGAVTQLAVTGAQRLGGLVGAVIGWFKPTAAAAEEEIHSIVQTSVKKAASSVKKSSRPKPASIFDDFAPMFETAQIEEAASMEAARAEQRKPRKKRSEGIDTANIISGPRRRR